MPFRKQPKPEVTDPKTVVARVPNNLTAAEVRRVRRDTERVTDLLRSTGAVINVHDPGQWY